MSDVEFIDLTHTIKDNMPVFPGDIPLVLMHERKYETDNYHNFILSTGLHVGTHIDTPMHMTDSSKMISTYSLDYFIGKGVLLNALGDKIVTLKTEYHQIVNEHDIVLINTGYSKHFYDNDYFINYPVLSEELIEFLIDKKIKILGLDTPSPDKYPFKLHKLLFNNNILIIENLCNLELLTDVKQFTIYALPLKINSDGALARVFAKII